MTRILRTGASNNPGQRPRKIKTSFPRALPPVTGLPAENKKGFTLIELIVVLVLISSVLVLALPRFSSDPEAYLVKDSERIAALLTYLSESSITGKSTIRIRFNIDEGFLTAESLEGDEFAPLKEQKARKIVLSPGVRFLDVSAPEGKLSRGEAIVIFAPSGVSGPFSVHLEAGGTRTISFNPFSNSVKISEGYFR